MNVKNSVRLQKMINVNKLRKKIFPRVLWRDRNITDGNDVAIYYPYLHQIHLLNGEINNLFIVLAHESFHWVTNISIRNDHVWEKINTWYDWIDNLT